MEHGDAWYFVSGIFWEMEAVSILWKLMTQGIFWKMEFPGVLWKIEALEFLVL